jgi:hypothetical protein
MQKVEGLLNVRGLSCEFHVDHRSLLDLDHAGLTIEVRRGYSNVELTRLRVEPHWQGWLVGNSSNDRWTSSEGKSSGPT